MKRVLAPFRWLVRIVANAAYKFYWDDCFSRASSLAYTTLFALVPMTALVFAMFRGFEIDEGQLQRMLENILPPNEGELLLNLKFQVFQYLVQFGRSVRELSTVSLAIVVFTGIALVNTIQSALNAVWRVSNRTSIISRIVGFWAVITLGPLLIAISFYWYSKVGSYTDVNLILPLWVIPLLNFFIPIASIWMALTLLFYNLPATTVAMRDAALGALIGAILFEYVKRGFAYYVNYSATYSAFYGFLVTIPLFLFWIYLLWIVVLFGAEISYQAGSIKLLSGLRKYASELGEIGVLLGLRILYVIGRNFVRGDAPPTEGEIALETGTDPVLVRTCLSVLAEADLITNADPQRHSRALRLSPDKITVGAVVDAFYSKNYRLKGEIGGELETTSGEGFLNLLRKTSVHADPQLPVREWTLTQFLTRIEETPEESEFI